MSSPLEIAIRQLKEENSKQAARIDQLEDQLSAAKEVYEALSCTVNNMKKDQQLIFNDMVNHFTATLEGRVRKMLGHEAATTDLRPATVTRDTIAEYTPENTNHVDN